MMFQIFNFDECSNNASFKLSFIQTPESLLTATYDGSTKEFLVSKYKAHFL